MKSEPELADLVASEERLTKPGVKVTMAEKGFGTRVAITAAPETNLGTAELESLLDELGESHRRPFSSA